MNTLSNVIIAGAGPAGLTAALSLRQRRIPYLLLERVSRERLCADVGGGYDISPNTLRMLDSLGVGAVVRGRGTRYAAVETQNSAGDVLTTLHLPDDLDVTSIRRPTLQRTLLEALGEERLRCGATVASVEQGDAGVTVLLEGGEAIRGDVLIAADGVGSRVRRAVFQDGEPRFCEVTCCWGRAPWDPERPIDGVPLDRAVALSGSGGSFFFALCEGEILWSAFWHTETFTRSADLDARKARVHGEFAGWHPLPQTLIAATDPHHIDETGIWDRPPAESWHRGRVVLIGDAAHPMTPFLGQGANSAMLDAFVVASHLARSEPAPAFAAYEERRKAGLDKNVKTAHNLCEWMTSESWWVDHLMQWMMRLVPSGLLLRSMVSADDINDVSDLLDGS